MSPSKDRVVVTRNVNRDASGVTVRSGHTVHLGAAVGRVDHVSRGYAKVHWISGAGTWEPCSRLTVQRALGRVLRRRGVLA